MQVTLTYLLNQHSFFFKFVHLLLESVCELVLVIKFVTAADHFGSQFVFFTKLAVPGILSFVSLTFPLNLFFLTKPLRLGIFMWKFSIFSQSFVYLDLYVPFDQISNFTKNVRFIEVVVLFFGKCSCICNFSLNGFNFKFNLLYLLNSHALQYW